MSFPTDLLPIRVDLGLTSGAWTDITPYVYMRGAIAISNRGRANEQSLVEPTECEFVANNRDYRWSARIPSSPWYGKVKAGTPCRVSVVDTTSYLWTPGTLTDYATTPDSASLSITGDMDIRVDIAPDLGWSGPKRSYLCGKYTTSGAQRSWRLGWYDRQLEIAISQDGNTYQAARCTRPIIALAGGRATVRVTVDCGAGSTTVTFYQGDSVTSASWTQLGDPIVLSGITAIYDSTSAYTVGSLPGTPSAGYTMYQGRIYRVQLRSGIGGAVVSDLDFTGVSPGTTSIVENARTWTITGTSALVTDLDIRFCGVIGSITTSADQTGTDLTADVSAAGPLRRLGQNQPALSSTLFQGIISRDPLAYWPMEDGSDATRLASAIPGVNSMQILGDPSLASYNDLAASDALPDVNGSEFVARVPDYTPSADGYQVRWVLRVPDSSPPPTGQTMVEMIMASGGSNWRFQVRYFGAPGNLQLVWQNDAGVSASTSGAFGIDGKNIYMHVEFHQVGSDVVATIATLAEGSTTGFTLPLTATGMTLRAVREIRVSPSGGITSMTVGHLHVQNTATSIFDLASEFQAWRGETAGERVYRLLTQEGYPCVLDGPVWSSATMGPQRVDDLLSLLRECEAVDGGVLYESRVISAIGYRTRDALLMQSPSLTIDHAAHQLSDQLTPIDDDQLLANDVTVTRVQGSSARTVVITGPRSSLDPPDGVGVAPASDTINTSGDDRLSDYSGWRAYQGTVNEFRYPGISVILASPAMVAAPTVARAVVAADIGCMATISHPPAWCQPDDIQVMIQGYSEVMTQYRRDITLQCSPGGAWVPVIWDSSSSRWDTAGSQLAALVNSSTTSWSVATTSGPVWSTTAVPYDVVCGGERVTVTAVAGTSSPQTFTVTRSVNGVAAGHDAGAGITLWRTGHYTI